MDRHAHNGRRVGDRVLASERVSTSGTTNGQSSDNAELDRRMRAAAFLEIHPPPGELHVAASPGSQLKRTRGFDCYPNFHTGKFDDTTVMKPQPRQEYRNNGAGYTAAESATPNEFDGFSPMDLDDAHDLEDSESDFLQMKKLSSGEKVNPVSFLSYSLTIAYIFFRDRRHSNSPSKKLASAVRHPG